MGLLRMLKYVLGTEDETQQPRQTQSSAKNANNAKPARTGQTKQTGQLARRVTQPQLQPHATPQRQSQRRQSQQHQACADRTDQADGTADRKSTRLNSSHAT